MSEFNLKQFYAEQDERMNLTEETVDDYSKRTALLRRRSQSSNAYPSSSRIQHGSFLRAESDARNAIPGAPRAPPTTLLPSQKITFSPEGRRTSEKRKASESLEPAVQKDVMIEPDKIRAITTDLGEMPLAPSQQSFATPKRSDDHLKAHKSSSPSLEDIDSFTVDLGNEALSLSTTNVEKRKPISIDVPPIAQKKRRINWACSPQIPEEHSPISSFSASAVYFPKKARSAQRNEDGLSGTRRVVPLPLVPQVLQKEARPGKIVSEPLASPIEDPSMVIDISSSQDSVEKKPLKSAASKILLGIQERIAAKQAGRSNDKVLKVAPKISKARSSKSTALPTGNPAAGQPILNMGSSELKAAGKKVRESMSGAQYAQKVLDDLASNTIKLKKSRPLEGTNVLFVGADANYATRNTEEKMIMIAKHGGNLMPRYDPDITTHIVSAENNTRNVLKATGSSDLKAIPERIPIVTWKWVEALIASRSLEEIAEKMLETWKHQSFQSRVVLTPMASLKTFKDFKRKQQSKATTHISNRSGSGPAGSSTDSNTYIPDVGQEVTAATAAVDDAQLPATSRQPGALLSPPTSPIRLMGATKAPTSTAAMRSDVNDPLAEFYSHAREQKELEEGWSSGDDINTMEQPDGDETNESEPEKIRPLPRAKRAWNCDTKGPQTGSQCPNQDIIDKLNELMKIHDAKVGDDQHWRVLALNKAIRALRSHPRRIKGYKDARGIPGIGEKTAMKIAEILETGSLRRIAHENSEDVQVTSLFTGIYGVGQTIALRWYSAGCRTLEDLKVGKGGVKLSSVQKIGLQFYDDINDRMPRTEAKHIYDLIKPIALSIDSALFIEVMGSCRRGKPDCGDIDILISRPTNDGLTHRGVLSQLLQELHKHGIITEDLALPDNPHDLEATYRGLCHLPEVKDARRRRIDILTVPWRSRGAALLYYTGDDIFNRAMRLKANHMGFSLNQRGLFGGVVRDPNDRRKKLDEGLIIASETEEDIFNILGVPWQEPHERVRG